MSCSLKKYKNVLGEPGKGVHKHRFLNLAIVDYILSIVLAMIITYFTGVPLVLTTIGVLILGIILHSIFGINTDVITYLGMEC